MRKFNLACSTIVGALALPTGALAEPIRLVSDTRAAGGYYMINGSELSSVQVQGDVLTGSVTFSNSTTTLAGRGTLVSSIADLTHMFGTGSASSALTTTVPIDARVQAAPRFSVAFELDRPYAFDFQALFSTSGGTDVEGGRWRAVLDMNNTGTPGGTYAAAFNDGSFSGLRGPDVTPFSVSGLLTPGVWQLFASVAASSPSQYPVFGKSNAVFTFRFDLTPIEPAPVPEPATILLCGSGLALTVLRRRRKANCTNI